jgi:hypothetical protein
LPGGCLGHLGYLQEVKEVSGEDELYGPLAAGQLLQEGLELAWGLEAVAAGVSAYVGVGDKDHQGVAAEFEHP